MIDIGAEYNHIHNEIIIAERPSIKLAEPYVYGDYNGIKHMETEEVMVPLKIGNIQTEIPTI